MIGFGLNDPSAIFDIDHGLTYKVDKQQQAKKRKVPQTPIREATMWGKASVETNEANHCDIAE